MKRYEDNWRVYAKKADFYGLGARLGVSPYLVRIMRNRDLTTEEEMRDYLFSDLGQITSYEKLAPYLNDPHQLKGMDLGVRLLSEAIDAHKKIRIVGDYDVDGISSVYILYRLLNELGADVDWRVPDRMKDGYGLNENHVQDAIADQVQVLLTCDNGIAAYEPVRLAKEAGMTVIVTDHHDVPKDEQDQEVLPPADAVIDPKQAACAYPFDGICGAVVAWKMMACLYAARKESLAPIYACTEIAAIATIADVMSLVGENRMIVKVGLEQMRHTHNLGLKALMEVQEIAPENLKCYSIGFVMAPMLNASGRLESAEQGINLLLSTSYDEALIKATELKCLNDQRKQMTEDAYKEALAIADTPQYRAMPVLVIFLENCHESVAGIVAGRIREVCNKPTIILTRDAQGEAKGSGRSIDTYHMFEGLCGCREFLTRFGGHPKAAGLSLPFDQVEDFRRAINERCNLTSADLMKTTWIDIPLPPNRLSLPLLEELDRLEPIGNGNPGARFAVSGLSVVQARILGKNQNTLKMTVAYTDPDTGRISTHDAITFQNPSEILDRIQDVYGAEEVERMRMGKPNRVKVKLIYKPSLNVYNGESTIQLKIEELLPC